MDEKLYQLVDSDDDRHRHKDKKEHKDSGDKEIQGRRQPLEGSKDKVYHLTTHFQYHPHKAEQKNRTEHEVNQHLYSERQGVKDVTAEGKEFAYIRQDKEQICYQSHILPSNPAASSK